MSVGEKIGIAAAFCGLIASFAGFIRWMVIHYLSELKPNSGSSLNDRVSRVEMRVDDIYTLLISRHAD